MLTRNTKNGMGQGRASRVLAGWFWMTLVWLAWVGASANAASLKLAWDPSPSPNIAGYLLYYGEAGAVSPEVLEVGSATSCTVTNLLVGRTYEFYVTCFNTLGVESPPSNTITHDVPDPVAGIVVDDEAAQFTGTWTRSTAVAGFWSTAYRHDSGAGKGQRTALFSPDLPAAGYYEVYEWHTSSSLRATNVPVRIRHAGGESTVTINQRVGGSGWNLLGVYPFWSGTNGGVLIDNTGTTGYVVADAVRFAPTSVLLPDLAVDPGRLRFSALAGDPIPSATLQVWNAGGGVMDFTVSTDTPWLAVQTPRGSSSGERDTVSVVCQPAGLAPGVYQGRLVVEAPLATDSPITIPVDLEITQLTTDVIVDDDDPADVVYTGAWTESTAVAGYFGMGYRHDGNTLRGTKVAEFRPALQQSGYYGLYEWHPASSTRATNALVEVVHAGGTNQVMVNQRLAGGGWNLLGVFPFWQGTNGVVRVKNDGANGFVIADAFRFAPTGESLPEISLDQASIGVRGMQLASVRGPTLQVRNTGGGTMNYQVSADVPWIKLSATGGSNSGEVDSIGIDLLAGTLAPGTYRGAIRVAAPGAVRSPMQVSVTLWVEPALSGVVIDDADSAGVVFGGDWVESTSVTGYWGFGYRNDGRRGDGQATAVYRPRLSASGQQEVFLWYTATPTRPTSVPVEIRHANGSTLLFVDQQRNGSQWFSIGRFTFNAGTNGYVQIGNSGTSGYVIADAVRFAPVQVATTAISQAGASAFSSIAPGPGQPLRLEARLSENGGLEVSWRTEYGHLYSVQWSTDGGETWQTVAEVVGDGRPATHRWLGENQRQAVLLRLAESIMESGSQMQQQ